MHDPEEGAVWATAEEITRIEAKLDWLHWAIARISQSRGLGASPVVDVNTGEISEEPGQEWPV